MKTPKTAKGYLKMLIQIAQESSSDLNNCSEEDSRAIGYIRASIQNDLSDKSDFIAPVLEKYKLKY